MDKWNKAVDMMNVEQEKAVDRLWETKYELYNVGRVFYYEDVMDVIADIVLAQKGDADAQNRT